MYVKGVERDAKYTIRVHNIFAHNWRRLLLRPGHLKCTYGRSGWFPGGGKTNSSQTATIVVIKQSPGLLVTFVESQ